MTYPVGLAPRYDHYCSNVIGSVKTKTTKATFHATILLITRVPGFFHRASDRHRTRNLLLTRQLLYQLSYGGKALAGNRTPFSDLRGRRVTMYASKAMASTGVEPARPKTLASETSASTRFRHDAREQATGLEPVRSAWKADVLPLTPRLQKVRPCRLRPPTRRSLGVIPSALGSALFFRSIPSTP